MTDDAGFAADDAGHMRRVEIRPGIVWVYEDHYFGEPWGSPPEAVVMLHGSGERSQAWARWVPHFARRFRVIRPNFPGFGVSPMPEAYDWTPEALAGDLSLLLDALGLKRIHLVGAKYGGSVAMRFAIDRPERLKSLTAVGSPVKRVLRPDHEGRTAAEEIQRIGRLPWLRKTMRARLGSSVSEAQIEWWTRMQSSGDTRAAIAATTAISRMDMEPELGAITAPTLLVTTTGSDLHSVAAVESYARAMRDARVVVLDRDSYHVAASDPDLCATHVLDFIGGRNWKA
jgi:pimeloyl-ACP methyl ester carboxylesterase